jgi:hypothetical protein
LLRLVGFYPLYKYVDPEENEQHNVEATEEEKEGLEEIEK